MSGGHHFISYSPHLALRYKKPIIPLKLHPDAELPFRLGTRQYIDFTGEFDTAVATLLRYLEWLASPEGVLQSLKERLVDAQRDLSHATHPHQKMRIQDDITLLEQQISQQQCVVEDPELVAQRVEVSIAYRLERERQPDSLITDISRSKFINPAPGIAPPYFQDRHLETKLVSAFLQDDAARLMTIVGRGGVGKTAME